MKSQPFGIYLFLAVIARCLLQFTECMHLFTSDCPYGFRCTYDNGFGCIEFNRECDGVNDCGNNYDEINCDNINIDCDEWEFPCKITHGYVCAPYIYRCDGEVDCIDRSDEKHCSVERSSRSIIRGS